MSAVGFDISCAQLVFKGPLHVWIKACILVFYVWFRREKVKLTHLKSLKEFIKNT